MIKLIILIRLIKPKTLKTFQIIISEVYSAAIAMATNPPGKGKRNVSCALDEELIALIDKRSDALGWSRAKFVIQIVENWRNSGAPSIHPAEASFQKSLNELREAARKRPQHE